MNRAIVSVCALIAASGSAAIASAQVWQAGISDAYQHQRWGAENGGSAALPGTPPRPNFPALGPVPTAMDNAEARSDWEATYEPVPNTVTFGGWCAQAAQVNMFYRFNTLGYSTFGPGAGGGNTVYTPATITEFQNEVAYMWKDFSGAAGGADPANGRPKKYNTILENRGTGISKGLDGLVACNYRQNGANVTYIGADGMEHPLAANSTLFNQIPGIIKRGDSTSVRMDAAPGGGSALNWWNFHVVTVAGYDVPNKTIWFADPDSNKGNGPAQAGWTAFDYAPTPAGSGISDWLAPKAGVASKNRRFGAGDLIPVPGGNIPNPPERDMFYFPGKLTADTTKFQNNDAGFTRYNGATPTFLETLERIKGAAKPAPIGAPPGAAKSFAVSPNAGLDVGMSEFYLFPAPGEAINVDSLSLSLPGWSALPFSGLDPLGEIRSSGWRFTATSLLFSLSGTQELDFDYFRTEGVIDAWDLVYNNFDRDPGTGFPVGSSSFFVQSIGDNAGYTLDALQVPAPGALGALGLGLIYASRRRRS